MKTFDWDALGTRAYNYVFDKTYLEKTGILYDYIINPPTDEILAAFPTVDEIKAHVPNGLGWHTGMEDGMISAGSMLNAIVNRYAVTGDKTLQKDAERIFKGIKICATVSDSRGFLARAVSPHDGKTFYPDSSRDQYTMVVFGLCRYYNSDLCSDENKAIVKDILLSFAERAVKYMTPENKYHYMRADGKPGVVDTMWKVAPHEALRLPMVYIAAWMVGGGDKYLDLYNELFDEGVTESLKYTNVWHGYQIAYQTQVSAWVCHAYDPDPAHKERVKEVMLAVADLCKDQTVNYGEKIAAGEYRFDLGTPNWHKGPCGYMGLELGEPYFMPWLPDDWGKTAVGLLMNMVPPISVRAACPDGSVVKPEEIEAFGTLLEAIDYEKLSTRCMPYVVDAYWWLKSAGQL